MEGCEASHPGMTIFSWVLAKPVGKPRIVEDPPHQESPPPKNEDIWCASPPQGLEQCERYMLVVTSSVGWLDLGVSGDDIRGPQSGRSLFQNPQMSAMFPPPGVASHYRGATLTELDHWGHYGLPVGGQLNSAIGQINDHSPTGHSKNTCHWVNSYYNPLLSKKTLPIPTVGQMANFMPYEHSISTVFIYSGDF